MQTFQPISPLYIDSDSGQKVSQIQAEQYRLWAVSSLPGGNMYSNERQKWRQQQLTETFIESREQLCKEESEQLSRLLAEYHDIFCLNDDERGETDLVEFKIDTGDASPQKQTIRKIPFVA